MGEVMKIVKVLNEFNNYDIKLSEETSNRELSIMLIGNGDLYMSITNGYKLKENTDDQRWIRIKKQDTDIYNAFDNLYNSIKEKDADKNIIDKNGNIIWVSDEGKEVIEDSMMIIKFRDYYSLIFYRNNKYDESCDKRKRSRNIDIRFSASDSRYKEYVSCFMNLYQELKSIEKPKIYKKGD